MKIKYRHLAEISRFERAFTLAEVLITLGIIGVVAAMTLPSVINKTRNKELHTAFLKTYSELNQVAGLFNAHYGISVSEYTAQENYSVTGGEGMKPAIANKIFAYYKGTKNLTSGGQGTDDGDGNFIPWYNMNNLNGSSFSGGANGSGKNSSFMCDNSAFVNNLSGALFILNDAPKPGQNGPVICVDVNGKKGPNRYGIDYFMFIFTISGTVIPVGQEHKNNPPACNINNGTCGNFNNIGAAYCSNTTFAMPKNTSCAYYALTDTHPTKAGKNYWQDFLGEVYSR